MSEYAIDIQHITKTYNMYKKPSDRFKEALSPTKKSYHDLFYALDDVTMQIKKRRDDWFCRRKWLWEINHVKNYYRSTNTNLRVHGD